MSQTIVVTVKPDGTTQVETRGFSGAACRDASRFLEAALGLSAQESFTQEFYQQATASPAELRTQSGS
jgi:hypothetical protein